MKEITIAEAIQRTVEHRELFHDEMLHIMRQIMRGDLTPAQIGGFVIGLRVKKETIGEITAAAQVMREFATRVPVTDVESIVDVVGTGGDGARTFNISTASIFVCAAAGASVAKHGNRAVSGSTGSADVLEALGANLALSPEQIALSINETGIGFMFAPAHHSALKHAAVVRKELGVRTIFNILGPLTNPAGAKRQLLGVFHPDLVGIHARVLQRLGSRHVMVVHGVDGMDEISLSGDTLVGELLNGEVIEYVVNPSRFGIEPCDRRAIQVNTVGDSKAMILAVMENQPGPALNVVLLNAGAAIYVAGLAPTIEAGVERAREVIARGAARRKLEQFVAWTRAQGKA
ncbi:MAG: anthranilate phosphoribosyltransferase [Betaproteobacteria bacterium]|nr:anthranilate phosphoribosyltransferase [Betaproteobacteria bacterium]